MPFHIIRQDITRMQVDAIVNAANTALQMGGGVCGAIFHAAGEAALQAACHPLAPIRTGEAVITPGFRLPARHVIHTAGPVYHAGHPEQAELLRRCYWNSLQCAVDNGLESIAFPLISSGIYGYPKEEALQVAIKAIREFLETADLEVYLAIYDADSVRVGEALLGAVARFIQDHEVPDQALSARRRLEVERAAFEEAAGVYPAEAQGAYPVEAESSVHDAAALPSTMDALPDAALIPDVDTLLDAAFIPDVDALPDKAPSSPKAASPLPTRSNVETKQSFARKKESSKAAPDLDAWVERLDEPFSTTLLRWIDAKGKTDVEVYKRANLDRKLFSKIRTGKGYTPSKRTAIALAVALELNLPETKALLERAGYALSRSHRFDLIVEYFITHGLHDIDAINVVLFSYDQPLLGG